MLASSVFQTNDPFGIFTLVVAVLSALIGAYVYGKRATLEVWRSTAEGYQSRSEQLEKQGAVQAAELAALLAKVEELEKRPDVDKLWRRLETQEETIRASMDNILSEFKQVAALLTAQGQMLEAVLLRVNGASGTTPAP
jgi:uncharacterized membrane protein YraQ (UPF0718 family)